MDRDCYGGESINIECFQTKPSYLLIITQERYVVFAWSVWKLQRMKWKMSLSFHNIYVFLIQLDISITATVVVVDFCT